MARDSSLLLRLLPWVLCVLLLGLFLRSLSQNRPESVEPRPLDACSADAQPGGEGEDMPPAPKPARLVPSVTINVPAEAVEAAVTAGSGEAPAARPARPVRPARPAAPAGRTSAPGVSSAAVSPGTVSPETVLPRPLDPEGRYAAAQREARLHAVLDTVRARAAALEAARHALAVRVEQAEARAEAQPEPGAVLIKLPGGSEGLGPVVPREASQEAASEGSAEPEAPSAEAVARWHDVLSPLDPSAPAKVTHAPIDEALSEGAEGLAQAAADTPALRPLLVARVLRSEASAASARELATLLSELADTDMPGTVPAGSWTLEPFAEAGVLARMLTEGHAPTLTMISRVAARSLGDTATEGVRGAVTSGLGSTAPERVALAARIAAHHASSLGAGIEEAVRGAWDTLAMEAAESDATARARTHVLHAAARARARSGVPAPSAAPAPSAIPRADAPDAAAQWRGPVLVGLAAEDARQRVAALMLAEAILGERLAFDPHGKAPARSKAIKALKAAWASK